MLNCTLCHEQKSDRDLHVVAGNVICQACVIDVSLYYHCVLLPHEQWLKERAEKMPKEVKMS